MTTERSTEGLVARLTADLVPVRPLPPLHRLVLAVAAAWAGSGAIVAGWRGLHPLAVIERGGVSTTLIWVLALIGFAGITLGLACRVPGRERLALVAARVGVLGVTVVIGVGLLLATAVADPGTLAGSGNCVGRSLLLAIPSGLLAVALAVRAAPWRHRTAGISLAVGAASLGALLVHLSCPSPSASHWLIAHALVPLAAAVPSGLLVAWVLGRIGRSSRLAADRMLDD